jgi:squalene-hopene/tetraprenyl-beta-curcumene cyclase
MNATMPRIGALAACLIAGTFGVCWHAETNAAGSKNPATAASRLDQPAEKLINSWDLKSAAAYLDRRATWWMDWPKAARDHETFCVSCHTAVPYALSRSALRKPLAEAAPSVNERRLLDNVTKRVRLWKEVAPFYSDADRGVYKSVESRGTESVLNALILASNDAQSGYLSHDTVIAFENMWAEQQTTGEKKGAWLWLRFANEPWEADDSDFYGATLAAIAVGTAPGNYRSKPEIQNNLKLLREYLNHQCAAQTTINRAVLLWASAKVPGLLDAEKQKAIITELLSKQQPDGGWSLSSLSGDWKRNDGTPQEVKSDGYATGLITFALQQARIPKENVQERQALAWLAANQSKTEGNWPSSSLNKNREHHLSPETALFMNDAATAYAVLALTEPIAIESLGALPESHPARELAQGVSQSRT